MRRIDRRDFGREAGLAFLSGVAVTISACGGGSGGSGSPTAGNPSPAAGAGDEVAMISANHGHSALVSAAQIAAGGAIQLDIRGTSGHPHMVGLPAEAVRDIKEGKAVELKSTTDDGHDHTVTFNADNPAPPTRY